MASTSVRFDFIGKDVSAGRTASEVERKFGLLGRTVGTVGKTFAFAIGGAAVGGVTALGAAMVQGVKDAQSYQSLALKTAAVIKSTGNEAHISVKGVQSLASQLESLSGVDEELIINSQNVLATFTRVRNETGKNNDIFTQATEAALNMSTALGEDLQSASIQVGKALNDPIKGITALQRVGVSFTQKQRDQIKALVDSGKTMQAQKLILKELSTEFGGAAEAAGKGFAGSVARAKDAASDFARDLGTKALPKLTEFADWFATTGVPKLRMFEGYVEKTLIPNVVGAFRDLKGKVEDALPDIDWSGISGNLKTQAAGWAGALISGVQLGLDKGDWKPLGESLGRGLSSAITVIGKGSLGLTKMISGWFSSVDWYAVGESVGRQAFPFGIGFVNTTFDGLMKVVKEHPWQAIFAALSFIGVGKLASAFKPLRAAIEALPFGKWFTRAMDKSAAPIFDRLWGLTKWMAREFWKGFSSAFPGVGNRVTRFFTRMADDIGARALYAAEKAAEWVGGLIKGAGRMTGNLVKMVGRIIWQLTYPFRASGSWLVSRGISLVGGLLRGIASTSVARTIAGVISRIVSPFRSAGGWLTTEGRQIVGGLLSGIRNQMGGIGGWVKSTIVDPLIHAVKFFFGIKSPSTVMMGIGSHLIGGLVKGMAQHSPGAIVGKVFGGYPKALSAMLGKGLISFASLPMKAIKAIGGFIGNLFGGGGGSGVQRWAGLVVQALGMLGQPTSLLGPVLNRMRRESGGNPNAINLTDINALLGHPSKGLMQVIGPTFAAYAGPFRSRGIWDPFANIYAGLNYALHRYGSLEYAMNKPGGYRLGGIAPAGRPFIAGEDGPELLYDSRVPWAVIPNARTYGQSAASWGGGTTVVYKTDVYLNGVSLGDRQVVKDVARAVKAARQNGDLHAADLK